MPPPAAWLLFTDMDGRHAVPLVPPGVVIGRDPTRSDVAVNDYGVSRVHARIDVQPDGSITLTDLKSKGGSQVNGIAATVSPIGLNDRLLLGKVSFLVAASPQAHSDARTAAALPPLPTRIRWVESLCAQLAAYHERGVAHGGLHDGRVRFEPDGSVCLDISPRDTLRIGNSPEQLVGQPFDARSDVFAAGCVAYKILTGRFPFAGATLSAVTYAMMYEDPPDPRPVVPVSASVVEWLRRALAKEPADRFRDGTEMRDAFRVANVSEVPRTASILLVSVPREAVSSDDVDRELYVINVSADAIEVRTTGRFLVTVDEDTGQGAEHGPPPSTLDVGPGGVEKVGDVLGWELDSALFFQVSFRSRGEAAWTHLGFDLKRPDDDGILPVLGVRGSRYRGRVVAENGASD